MHPGNITPAAIRSLTLMLTNRCNLRCAYCYHGKLEHSMDMSEDTLCKALDLVQKFGSKGFHVQLTGGEATLVPHLIALAVQKIRALDPTCTIALQTNATRLNRDLVRLLHEYGIDVGVSLDGPPKIQEQLRGEAAASLQGLNLLEAAHISFRVTTVVSRINAPFLPQVALLLSRYEQARGMGLDLLVHKGRAADCRLLPAEPEVLVQSISKLVHTIREINRRRTTPLHLREQDLVAHRMTSITKESTRAFCHAQQGTSLAVTADGRLYPCSQTCGDAHFAAGTLDAPLPISAFTDIVLSKANPLCADCLLQHCCPGDCPSRIHYNQPDTNNLSCLVYQTIAKNISPTSAD